MGVRSVGVPPSVCPAMVGHGALEARGRRPVGRARLAGPRYGSRAVRLDATGGRSRSPVVAGAQSEGEGRVGLGGSGGAGAWWRKRWMPGWCAGLLHGFCTASGPELRRCPPACGGSPGGNECRPQSVFDRLGAHPHGRLHLWKASRMARSLSDTLTFCSRRAKTLHAQVGSCAIRIRIPEIWCSRLRAMTVR